MCTASWFRHTGQFGSVKILLLFKTCIGCGSTSSLHLTYILLDSNTSVQWRRVWLSLNVLSKKGFNFGGRNNRNTFIYRFIHRLFKNLSKCDQNDSHLFQVHTLLHFILTNMTHFSSHFTLFLQIELLFIDQFSRNSGFNFWENDGKVHKIDLICRAKCEQTSADEDKTFLRVYIWRITKYLFIKQKHITDCIASKGGY